jgi:hypothetical protein
MADPVPDTPTNEIYGSGIASLIGGSGMISLDGQSIQLPPDDQGFDINDDISSINDSTYNPGAGGPPSIYSGAMKIVGTAESMEEGKLNRLTPASIALSDQMRSGDDKALQEQNSTSEEGSGERNKIAPDMNNTSKISVKGKPVRRKGQGVCIPAWIQAAPKWLRFVIAFSTAMFIGAVVLVTIALSTALASRDEVSVVTNLTAPGPGNPSPETLAPSSIASGAPLDEAEVDSHSEDAIESSTPPKPEDSSVTEATKMPSPEKTETSAAAPGPESEETTSPPATEEENIGTDNASESPAATTTTDAPKATGTTESSNYDSMVTTFFVTGGRFTGDTLTNVPAQLRTLPVRGGTSFLVHLGDWNSPYATRCDRQSYQDVNDLFSNSSIPTYFLPGDNDYNGKWQENRIYLG